MTRKDYELIAAAINEAAETVRHPDTNRYVMQLFLDGRKISGGTAWYAILDKVPSPELP